MKFALILATLVSQCNALEIAGIIKKAKKGLGLGGGGKGDGKNEDIYGTTDVSNGIQIGQVINQSLLVNMTGWLATGHNPKSPKWTPPVYIRNTATGSLASNFNKCPTLFNAPDKADLKSEDCFKALVQYLGNSGTGPFGNARARLNDAMTALSRAVGLSVDATDLMKDKMDKIVKAVLFNDRNDGAKDKRKKILNQEVQLRNMISLIRTSLNSVSASTGFDAFNKSLTSNLKYFEGNATDEFGRLVDNIDATVEAVLSGTGKNLSLLSHKSQELIPALNNSIIKASIDFSNAVGPLKTNLTSLNVTEVATMSRMEEQVTDFNSDYVPLNSGLDTVIKEGISNFSKSEQGRLDKTLEGISTDFVVGVSNSRTEYTIPVQPKIEEYDQTFSLDLARKNFGNLVGDLSSKITKLINEADVVMQGVISKIHSRVSQVRLAIFPLRDSDQQQALEMANQVGSFLTDLNSVNQDLATTSKILMDQIAKTKTDLLSQVNSDSSGKLDYLFKNIVNALTQIAEVKKASLENVKAKLASMDATIAKLLASSGLSAEEFFRKIDGTATKMRVAQANMRTASFDAKAQSAHQTRDIARTVTNQMSIQEARLALSSTALQAAREAANNMVKVSNVGMVNDAGTAATDAFQFLASANLQAYRANADVKMNVTNSVLALGPDFKIVGNDVRLLNSEIKSVVDGVGTLDADELAGSRVISDYLTEFVDAMERLIEFFYLTTVEDGKTDLEKVYSDQNSKVSNSGENQSDSIAKMSSTLGDTEDPFIKAVNDVKVPDLQEPIDTIGQAVSSAWSEFKSDAIDRKIASLNDTTITDMATAKSDQAQALGAKTSEIAESLTNLLGWKHGRHHRAMLGSVVVPLTKFEDDRLDFSGKLANISHQTAVISTSGGRLMSDFSETNESDFAEILDLSTIISDFVLKVGPDFTVQNNSAYARKSTLDKNASDLMVEAGSLFSHARQKFQTKLESILSKATVDSESVKAVFDSTQLGAAIPTVTSMAKLDKLIENLLVYALSLPNLTGTVEDENTELMMINVFAPLIKYIAFANSSFLTQERVSSETPDVTQIISWTGAVANSTWGAGEAAADFSTSKLMRSSAESSLNSQVTKLQLERLHGFLDGQVAETAAAVNASATATEDATKGAGYALKQAGSDTAGAGFEIAGTFADAAANLSVSQQDFSNSIASADSSVASLSSGFNSLISGSLTELMAQFTGMAKQLSQHLPITASIAVDVEKGRLVRSFNQATQNISTTSDNISAYFQQANTSLRDIQVSTKRFEAIGAAINSMKNNIVVLEKAAIADANKAADDAVAAEKVRISDEIATITSSLANLKKSAAENIARLSV